MRRAPSQAPDTLPEALRRLAQNASIGPAGTNFFKFVPHVEFPFSEAECTGLPYAERSVALLAERHATGLLAAAPSASPLWTTGDPVKARSVDGIAAP